MSLGCAYLVISPESKGSYVAPLVSHLLQDIPFVPRLTRCQRGCGDHGQTRTVTTHLPPAGPRTMGPQRWLEALTFTAPPTLNCRHASQCGDCTDHFQTKICHSTTDNTSYLADTNAAYYAKSKRVTNWAQPVGFAHSCYTVSEPQLFWGQRSDSDAKWMLAKCI